jgi:hypothetical protein
MYIRAHMCVCPRVVNPSTGLGGVGEAPFLCVCPSVPPFATVQFCFVSITHYPVQYNPSTGMYICTGIGDAGESHGKALGRVTRGGVPLYVHTSTSSVLYTSSGISITRLCLA